MPPTAPIRVRTRLSALVAGVVAATGVVVPAPPAAASGPVRLHLPVPCGTVLNDTTYATHWPNTLSVDFNVPGAGNRDRGVPIVAPADGRVVEVTPAQGQVELDLGSGVHVWLLHMSGVTVQAGDRVSQGERIGGMDSVGYSTGVHLHMHMSVDGRWVTPTFVEGPVDYRASTLLESRNACGGTGDRYEPLAGDFDGDGVTDVALRGAEDGTFFIKLGPDHDSNQSTFEWTPGAHYQAIAGDFDGRGATDIGLRDPSDGRFFLRTGIGFAEQHEYEWTPGAHYQAIAGDFDGDGLTDIGLRDVDSGRFFLKLGPDYDTNQTEYAWAPGAEYRAFAGDVDGDGTAELGLRDAETGTMFVKHGPDYDDGQTTYRWSPGAQYVPFTFDGGFGLRHVTDGTLFLKDGPRWSAGQTTYRWAPG